VSAKVLLLSFNRYKVPVAVFPLGLAYVADALLAAGYKVLLIDLNIDEADWAEKATAFKPDVAGISVRNVDEVNIDSPDTLLGGLKELVDACRALHPKAVAIGGPAVSLFPAEILALCGADYAIKGEGETAFRLLTDDLMRGIAPSYLWLLKAGDTHAPQSAPAGFCTKFDKAIRARIAPYYITESGMVNIQTQRGCPMKCCYCTYPSIEGRIVRQKPVEAVLEELSIIKRCGARYFFIVDGVFNNSNAYVTELCEAMIRAKLDMQWCCFIRPSGIDAELATLMARAGLAHAECGSDTLSEAMLASYGKHFGFEQVQRSSMALLGAGIKICHYLIFGGPGETPETVAETFDNSRAIPGGIFFASTGLRVYPNTPLHQRLVAENPCWGEVSMLKPRFYLSPAFTEASISELIRIHAEGRSVWIVQPVPPAVERDIAKMRHKGILGPLWDYMELMQRFRMTAALPPLQEKPRGTIVTAR
jgi:radical SAM superfamily enzyme YgiQ (UPF0313 family)